MKPEGWEDLLSDRSILVFLRSAVRDAFGIMEDRDESMDFELIDLGCERCVFYIFADLKGVLPKVR